MLLQTIKPTFAATGKESLELALRNFAQFIRVTIQ
jgi:hypothetical protein